MTRRPKEIASSAELRSKVKEAFRQNGFEMFVAPVSGHGAARAEPEAKLDADAVVDQGVQAVFERAAAGRIAFDGKLRDRRNDRVSAEP